jgi:hypothetical protein
MKDLICLLSIASLMFFSCGKSDLGTDILYFNSFETTQDTTGIGGYCFLDLVKDAPPEGGNQSLAVSCGCIGPHANFKIGPFSSDNNVKLSFWGKGKDAGGSVSMKIESDYIGINIPGNNTSWRYYSSDDTLRCPAGKEITISLSAGGAASGQITVDMLKVEKVD